MKLLILVLIFFANMGFGEILKFTGAPRVLDFQTINNSIFSFSDDIYDIESIVVIIRHIEFSLDHMQVDEVFGIEELVPAIGVIVKSYDRSVTPLVLDYALHSDSVFIKRRCVYVIEKLEGVPINEYLDQLLGGDSISEKQLVLESCLDQKKGLDQYFDTEIDLGISIK